MGHGAESAAAVLAAFAFPAEAAAPTSDPAMRRALLEAHGGLDYYTRQPLAPGDMVVDHVVPRSLGGPDNVFNYVPTTQPVNGAKGGKFDPLAATAVLSVLRTHYAPKALRAWKRATAAAARPAAQDTPRARDGALLASLRDANPRLGPREEIWAYRADPAHCVRLADVLERLREAVRAAPEARVAVDEVSVVADGPALPPEQAAGLIRSLEAAGGPDSFLLWGRGVGLRGQIGFRSPGYLCKGCWGVQHGDDWEEMAFGLRPIFADWLPAASDDEFAAFLASGEFAFRRAAPDGDRR